VAVSVPLLGDAHVGVHRAVERVVRSTALERVITVAAADAVQAVTAGERVHAVAAIDRVVTVASADHVGSSNAINHIVPGRSQDDISFGCAHAGRTVVRNDGYRLASTRYAS